MHLYRAMHILNLVDYTEAFFITFRTPKSMILGAEADNPAFSQFVAGCLKQFKLKSKLPLKIPGTHTGSNREARVLLKIYSVNRADFAEFDHYEKKVYAYSGDNAFTEDDAGAGSCFDFHAFVVVSKKVPLGSQAMALLVDVRIINTKEVKHQFQISSYGLMRAIIFNWKGNIKNDHIFSMFDKILASGLDVHKSVFYVHEGQ